VTPVRVAAAAWAVERPGSLVAWQERLAARLGEAAAAGARLAVVPEYASLELVGLAPGGDVRAQLDALQACLADYLDTHAELARRLDMYLLAGTFPERDPDGRLRNRARLFGPGGGAGAVTKRQLTRFERRWELAPGDDARVFATDLGPVGVAICYDAEFPLIVRRQVDAGARIVLVPSCTDTLAGYWRVRIAAQARALENQCFAVHASTVGDAPWCAAVDENHGAAGCFAPPDTGFPADGVVAVGAIDAPGWVLAELDQSRIEAVRRTGQVASHLDWDLPRHLAGPVEVVPVV